MSKSQPIHSLYICPWSLRDPLCQSQSLGYIRGLAAVGYKFALITFETAVYKMDAEAVAEQKKELAKQGLYWYPVDWPAGNSVTYKLSGIISVILLGIKVCRRHRPQLIHSRSSLPVFAAIALKKLFRTKFLYDADSLLSQEYLDVGHITRESRAYKILAWSEKCARAHADHVIVLTNKLRGMYIGEFGVKAPVDVIPCCVDTSRFRFDPEAREKLRSELGINEEVVVTYVGKSGSWYLVEETFGFFKSFAELFPASRLLIISKDDPQIFHQIAAGAGVEQDLYFLRSAVHTEIPKWLSACDVSLSLIKQVRSKIGSSPVKFAEYLSVGLPVVSTDNIGDCSEVIDEEQVGVLIKELNVGGFEAAAEELGRLMDDPGLAERCKNAARKRFDLEAVGSERYRRIYGQLLGAVEVI